MTYNDTITWNFSTSFGLHSKQKLFLKPHAVWITTHRCTWAIETFPAMGPWDDYINALGYEDYNSFQTFLIVMAGKNFML